MNPLRAAACLAWFFGGCLVLVVFALIPRHRFRLSYLFGRKISPTALKILGIEVELRHGERLRTGDPYVLIANHQHLFDIFLMASLLPPGTITVGKRSIRWIPVFGWLFQRTGNLLIDRGVKEHALGVMETAHRYIVERRLSVVVMPEGTRSLGKGLLPFKKGAFHLAVGTELPLLPIAISSMSRLNFWRRRAGKLLIDVQEAIPTRGLGKDGVPALMAEARARMQAAIDGLDAELAH